CHRDDCAARRREDGERDESRTLQEISNTDRKAGLAGPVPITTRFRVDVPHPTIAAQAVVRRGPQLTNLRECRRRSECPEYAPSKWPPGTSRSCSGRLPTGGGARRQPRNGPPTVPGFERSG